MYPKTYKLQLEFSHVESYVYLPMKYQLRVQVQRARAGGSVSG